MKPADEARKNARTWKIRVLDPQMSAWSDEIDDLRRQLGAPHNPTLFPPHFLKATFPRIGGQVLVMESPRQFLGAGFLFPHEEPHSSPAFTLRFHSPQNLSSEHQQAILEAVRALVGQPRIRFYDPLAPHTFISTSESIDHLEIGQPDAGEAAGIRALQQAIWQSEPDDLYPVDIHATDFRPCTSLVARVEGQLAGFVFGFYKLAGPPLPEIWATQYRTNLRIESQLLGVAPAYRGRQIGFGLKKAQAIWATRQGIEVIHWTADPLQFGNAVLNFGRLKAMAWDFYPDYYPFRNVLNQITASRLALTWLIQSPRVKRALADPAPTTILPLAGYPGVEKVNTGWQSHHLDATAPTIAIEVPANWTILQQTDFQQALQWRHTTDALFQHYLGCTPGKYVITGVGTEGEHRYLIAEKVTPALYRQLIA